VIALLLLWWKRGGFAGRDLVLLVPFFAAGTTMGLITLWVESHALGATGREWEGISRLERGLIGARALWFYLSKLLWPHPLMFMYSRWTVRANDPLAYVPLAAAIAVLLLLWHYRQGWGRPALFVAAYFVCMLNLGRVLATQGNLDQAISHFSKTIELDPDYAPAHFSLGNALAANGNALAAIAHYRRALELDPNFAPAHSSLGRLLAAQGKPAESIEQYRQALAIDPRSVEALANLANALVKENQFADAIEYFHSALELDRPALSCTITFAVALDRQGQKSEAQQELAKARQLQAAQAPPASPHSQTGPR
jgi:tetratricopeptide (TPR) repeat protein